MRPKKLAVGMAIAAGSLAVVSVLELGCSSDYGSAEQGGIEGGTTEDAMADVRSEATLDANASDGGADSAPCVVGTCRIVFVTSEAYTGNLGGLPKADEACETLAQASSHAAVRGRSFRAWLSAPDAGARDLHATENKPYVRVDGVMVATDWNQLTSVFQDAGALLAPIQIDEKGGSAMTDLVWTGTTYNGFPSANTCTGWTSASGAGQIGRADRTDEAWTDTDVVLSVTGDCSKVARLYCFEK